MADRNGDRELIAAFDAGSDKLACVIGRAAPGLDADDDPPVACLGVGRRAARVGPDRTHLDFDGAARSLRLALEEALHAADAEAALPVVAYGGPGLKSRRMDVAVALRGPVDDRAIASALLAAKADSEADGRRLLKLSPTGYQVDSGPETLDPRGLSGKTLRVRATAVHAPEEAVAALSRLIAVASGRAPASVQPAPYAAGLAALSPAERASGAIVLDLGDANAGLGVFRNGALVWAETIAWGGAKITGELARRLSTNSAVAERLKRDQGGAERGQGRETLEVAAIGVDGRLEPVSVARAVVSDAIADGLIEGFSKIAERLDWIGEPGDTANALPVALCGGMAAIPGLRTLAQRALGRPARLGTLLDVGGFDDGDAAASFAVAAGLVRYWALRDASAVSARADAPPHAFAPGVVRRIGQAAAWFRENF